MNFIMKFLEKRFIEFKDKLTLEVSAQNLKVNCVLDKFYDTLFANGKLIKTIEERVTNLEGQFKTVRLILGETILRKNDVSIVTSTTDAIIDILTHEDGKKLHYSIIYDNIKRYNLTNPNVSLQSVKAILYQLARQKRIVLDNGTETGMFFIEKK